MERSWRREGQGASTNRRRSPEAPAHQIVSRRGVRGRGFLQKAERNGDACRITSSYPDQRPIWLSSERQEQASSTTPFRLSVPSYSYSSPAEVQPSNTKGRSLSAGIHSPLYFRARWRCVPFEMPPSQEACPMGSPALTLSPTSTLPRSSTCM